MRNTLRSITFTTVAVAFAAAVLVAGPRPAQAAPNKPADGANITLSQAADGTNQVTFEVHVSPGPERYTVSAYAVPMFDGGTEVHFADHDSFKKAWTDTVPAPAGGQYDLYLRVWNSAGTLVYDAYA